MMTDTERLDWLIEHEHRVVQLIDGRDSSVIGFCVDKLFSITKPSAREAIDSCMRGEEAPH